MNLRELRYIVAVADLRSFSRAAERCAVSQPTLSAQIKKVEATLGVALFERTNKRVMPTQVGAQVIPLARRVLQEVEAIEEIAATAQDPLTGRYRIGAFPTLASYLLPDLVPRLVDAMPHVRLVLVEEKSDLLVKKLRNGALDAAFLALPVHDDFLMAEHVFDDPFYVAVCARNELAICPCIGAHILSQHQLLLLDEGHCLRDQALDVCELMGVSDEADMRATSLETLRQMVRADTGVTLMPDIATRAEDPEIRYIPLAGDAPYRSIGLVRRKTCQRTAVFTRVLDAARALKNGP